MATKKTGGNRRKARNAPSVPAAMTKRLATKKAKNAKLRTKAHYDDAGAMRLLAACAAAMAVRPIPQGGSAETRRMWCAANAAPTVRRDEVCRKATNYRADNAVRARLASLQAAGVVSASLTVVWGVPHDYAKAHPFTPETETVYLVRTK